MRDGGSFEERVKNALLLPVKVTTTKKKVPLCYITLVYGVVFRFFAVVGGVVIGQS